MNADIIIFGVWTDEDAAVLRALALTSSCVLAFVHLLRPEGHRLAARHRSIIGVHSTVHSTVRYVPVQTETPSGSAPRRREVRTGRTVREGIIQ